MPTVILYQIVVLDSQLVESVESCFGRVLGSLSENTRLYLLRILNCIKVSQAYEDIYTNQILINSIFTFNCNI